MPPLILVYYINVGNLPDYDVQKYIEKVSKFVNDGTNNFVNYIIPVRGQETKVECLNPVQVKSDVYNNIINKLEEVNVNLVKYFER